MYEDVLRRSHVVESFKATAEMGRMPEAQIGRDLFNRASSRFESLLRHGNAKLVEPFLWGIAQHSLELTFELAQGNAADLRESCRFELSSLRLFPP